MTPMPIALAHHQQVLLRSSVIDGFFSGISVSSVVNCVSQDN